MKNTSFHLQYKRSGTFATGRGEELSYPQNLKMCDPILVTLLKMQPHYSQSSRENATPSSDTSQQPHPPASRVNLWQVQACAYMALNNITKMESQRDEASQRLVKHYIIIMVSLHSFP